MSDIDVATDIQSFTSAELAKIYRQCAVSSAVAREYKIGDELLSRLSAVQLEMLADKHQRLANLEKTNSRTRPTIGRVRFRRPGP